MWPTSSSESRVQIKELLGLLNKGSWDEVSSTGSGDEARSEVQELSRSREPWDKYRKMILTKLLQTLPKSEAV